MLRKKIQKCFHTSNLERLYGRVEEQKFIETFIQNDMPILHITGNPGTGKTCTVNHLLKNESFEYVNYYNEPDINRRLAQVDKRIVVIDEFDKYFLEQKNECIKNILNLKKIGKKVITISNNLRIGNLKFRPYSANQIYDILKEKIKTEIGIEIADDRALKFVAKRFDKSGDLRAVFKYILDAFKRKINKADISKEMDKIKAIGNSNSSGCEDQYDEKENMVFNKSKSLKLKTRNTMKNNTCKKEQEEIKLEIADLVTLIEVNETKNIHHQIIFNIVTAEHSVNESYKDYIKECDLIGIPTFDRNDFKMVFEMYK